MHSAYTPLFVAIPSHVSGKQTNGSKAHLSQTTPAGRPGMVAFIYFVEVICARKPHLSTLSSRNALTVSDDSSACTGREFTLGTNQLLLW